MKTSLAVVSVLLAGVALEVAAYRINDNVNQRESNQQWSRLQQETNGNDDSTYNVDVIGFGQNNDEFQNNHAYKNMNNDNFDLNFERSRQFYQNEGSNFGSRSSYNDELNEQRYRNENQVSVDPSARLTKKMVEKIATLHNIALKHNIAENTNDLENVLSINKNIIKLPEQNFVTFYNSTMKYLNNGNIENMYINPEKDVVLVQYKFDQVQTAGSFKSNIHNAKLGYFTIVLNKVSSNVSTGFNSQHNVIRPAKYQNADAYVKTEDGTITEALNSALENRYLNVLGHVVSNEVLKSTNKGMIAEMKHEIRQPMWSNNAENSGKLYDMRWKEDNLAMQMSYIGFQNAAQAKPMLTSVTFNRNFDNTYSMRYYLTLSDLEWTSDLIIESAGKRMSTRSANFEIEKVNIQVTVTKSFVDQQQSCGKFNTIVEVRGLQYNLDENVQPELMSKVENNLRRFIEHSLGAYVQESLKQEIC